MRCAHLNAIPIVEDKTAFAGRVTDITRRHTEGIDQMLSFLNKQARGIEIGQKPFVQVHIE